MWPGPTAHLLLRPHAYIAAHAYAGKEQNQVDIRYTMIQICFYFNKDNNLNKFVRFTLKRINIIFFSFLSFSVESRLLASPPPASASPGAPSPTGGVTAPEVVGPIVSRAVPGWRYPRYHPWLHNLTR